MEDKTITSITTPVAHSSRRDRSAHPGHLRDRNGEFNEGWELDDASGYSVDNFYTSTTFGKGDESVNLGQLRVPNSVSAEISVLVQSGKLPKYKGWQEFARDAIYHRLYYVKGRLAKDGDDIFVEFAAFHQNAESERMDSEIALQKANVEAHARECRHAVEAGDWFALDRAITRIKSRLEGLRYPYRGQMESLVGEFEGFLPKVEVED